MGYPTDMTPKSLKAGATAALRRIVAGAAAANGPPTLVTDGIANWFRWLHVVILLTGATSVQWRLWLWSATAEKWCLDTRPGASGTVTLATAAADNPQISIIEVAQAERVYIELLTFTGPPAVDVWLEGANSSS